MGLEKQNQDQAISLRHRLQWGRQQDQTHVSKKVTLPSGVGHTWEETRGARAEISGIRKDGASTWLALTPPRSSHHAL